MGHKIHPSGLRLGITQEHRSKWFATSKTYPILLQEDFKIRTFIQKKYGAAGISDVLIARKADQLELELKTARPGVIVGRQGSGIEELRSGIQKTIGDRTRQVRINVVEVERVDADAFLLAEYIAQQLEKRVAFRRTIRMALQSAKRAGVLGLKIQVGGRLNGAEIDYATREANTTYGVLGIKVWVFKGEVLPKEEQTIPVGATTKRKASRRPQQFEDRSNENS